MEYLKTFEIHRIDGCWLLSLRRVVRPLPFSARSCAIRVARREGYNCFPGIQISLNAVDECSLPLIDLT